MLDASALMAWTHGHLGMATWSMLAAELGLTLLVPAHARTEALVARPEHADLVEVLLARPSVLVVDDTTADQRALIDDRFGHDGAFDPLATWVAALCVARGWPALSSDPARLRRAGPTIDVDRL